MSFDEFRGADQREVVKEFESLSNRDLRRGRFLVLLDEIQKLEGWEDQLKALYDLHKGRVKFVISGSESFFIRRRSRETLAGRLFELRVEPLSFPSTWPSRASITSRPISIRGNSGARTRSSC